MMFLRINLRSGRSEASASWLAPCGIHARDGSWVKPPPSPPGTRTGAGEGKVAQKTVLKQSQWVPLESPRVSKKKEKTEPFAANSEQTVDYIASYIRRGRNYSVRLAERQA